MKNSIWAKLDFKTQAKINKSLNVDLLQKEFGKHIRKKPEKSSSKKKLSKKTYLNDKRS